MKKVILWVMMAVLLVCCCGATAETKDILRSELQLGVELPLADFGVLTALKFEFFWINSVIMRA